MTLEEFIRRCDDIVPDEYDCHPYPGATLGFYHVVWIDGCRKKVHRLALERNLGRSIRPGYQALHTCDYKSCVNQDHLYEGTPTDNMRDRVLRDPESFSASKSERKKEQLKRVQKLSVEAFKKKYPSDPEFRAMHLAKLEKGREVLRRKNETTVVGPDDAQAQTAQ